MRHLIIGRGEVGSALLEVLSSNHPSVTSIDKGETAEGKFDVIHVAFPCAKQDTFTRILGEYLLQYALPEALLIIHSTVPLGTTSQFGLNAVHSPIRGVHPNIAQGVRTFEKFFGGFRAAEASTLFPNTENILTDRPESTEALKLWDTTYYGWNIVFERAVKAYCDRFNLDFNVVYTEANRTYNKGYANLGRNDVQRPVLAHMDGPIGGHCVVPNARLLDSVVARVMLEMAGEFDPFIAVGSTSVEVSDVHSLDVAQTQEV